MTSNKTPNKTPNKIDVAEALRLRIQRGMTYQEIADKLGCAKSTVYTRIHEILKLVDDPQANRAFAENQVNILKGAERVLLSNMVEPEKLKKASVNNLAYAFQQIHNARRLEQGLSTENVDIHAQYEEHLAKIRESQARKKAIRAKLLDMGIDPEDPQE